MLKVIILPEEHYDEDRNLFFKYPEQPITLFLEHSLLSISKWEEKWHKPFLTDERLSVEETLDYIKCMIVKSTPSQLDSKWLYNLDRESLQKINDYIADPMTATFFNEQTDKKSKNKKIITNELIYYWMVSYQIPFSCEKWHINKLITLIKVCNAENEAASKDSKKNSALSKNDVAARRALNAQRRARLHSRG